MSQSHRAGWWWGWPGWFEMPTIGEIRNGSVKERGGMEFTKNLRFQKLLKLSWGPKRGEENQIFFSFFFIGGKSESEW